MNDKKFLLKKKKQLLAYVTAATIGVSMLTGCGNTNFRYEKNKDGKIETVSGEIDYDSFKDLKFIHLTNNITNIDDYILAKYFYSTTPRTGSLKIYTDIENGKEVYNSSDTNYSNFNVDVIVDNMVDYLYKYNMMKDFYTIDDVTKLKENLLTDSDLNIKQKLNKKLVK